EGRVRLSRAALYRRRADGDVPALHGPGGVHSPFRAASPTPSRPATAGSATSSTSKEEMTMPQGPFTPIWELSEEHQRQICRFSGDVYDAKEIERARSYVEWRVNNWRAMEERERELRRNWPSWAKRLRYSNDNDPMCVDCGCAVIDCDCDD